MRAIDIPEADAIVIGSGPNGMAAAIRLAQQGWKVVVLEAAPTPGGGVRSAELTLPGFVHDVCSSVYPMAVCSPFFSTLPLSDHGLEWVFPPAALAHPLDDGSAAMLYRNVDDTAAGLGSDAGGYQRLIGELVPRSRELIADSFAPPRLPKHPVLMAKFGLLALRSVRAVAHAYFRRDPAKALYAGIGAHAMLPLEKMGSSAVAIMLALAAHAAGWPIARGGSQKLTDALISYFKTLGGVVLTDCCVESIAQLPPIGSLRAVLLDITPRQLLQIAGDRLPGNYKRKLQRYRYGMAAFKMDWALREPVPWRVRECSMAGTVHVGGTLDEISDSERRVWRGEVSERPFVLFVQSSLFDSSRAPAGQHTAWGYCHVPNGYDGDPKAVVEKIESQVERFAPGFRDCILARSVRGPAELEKYNPNLVGGDISGGVPDLRQLFLRPTASLYRTPLPGIFLCSSSTPPAPGVHGMCGYFAAESALKHAPRRR